MHFGGRGYFVERRPASDWLSQTRSVGDKHEETGESPECSEREGAGEEKRGANKGRRESREGGDKIPDRPFKLHLGHGSRVAGATSHDARLGARWVVG